MADERLRDLERRARAGEADAALAWAGALDRLGRADDAFDALWGARDDARVRRELSRWSERCRLGDAKPVQWTPRVRWAVEPAPGEALLSVLVHPLGPVVTTPSMSLLLDADTGDERARFEGRPTALASDLALCFRRRQLTGWDVWTGEQALATSLTGQSHANTAAGDLIVRCARGWVRVEQLPDPRVGPPSGWHHDLGTILMGSAVVSGDRVVVHGKTLEKPGRPLPHEVRGLDLDGHLVWRRVGDGRLVVHAVGGGEVAVEADQRVTLLDRDGAARWSVWPSGQVWAVGPATLVVHEVGRRGSALVWLDRATGQTLHRMERASKTQVTLQRDVAVLAGLGRGVQALSATGARLWELDLATIGARSGAVRLWPAHGRFYVSLGISTLACIDESPAPGS